MEMILIGTSNKRCLPKFHFKDGLFSMRNSTAKKLSSLNLRSKNASIHSISKQRNQLYSKFKVGAFQLGRKN